MGILQEPHHEQHLTSNGCNDGKAKAAPTKRKRDASPHPQGSDRKRHALQGNKNISESVRASQQSEDVVSVLENAWSIDDPATCMPEVWTRSSILIRINSLASAQSAVQPALITTMTDLLKHNIMPRIPLRGSISASGDLMPLSYIAGTLLGKPTLTVVATEPNTGKRRVTTADLALKEVSIQPITLGPKEGLAIVNGTAVSAGVAALAIHEAHGLTVLSQVLTAMSVEALRGTSESFDPFFAKVRPHVGQAEASHNIYSFLDGSQLIQNPDGSEEGSLRQDRYSIRTAAQWLSPVLEDFVLAHQQISVECNSVTDNPLIDGQRVLHGGKVNPFVVFLLRTRLISSIGNFQARTITSAMEKTRIGLQSIGRMLFTQCTELINPKTNRGLSPNLVADEPSASWLMKPLDIMIAALLSELGFLANPVGTHVQTAEMGNQALNSMALVSARYCHMALDVLSQLAAGHLLAVCQALDLRAMHEKFREAFEPELLSATEEIIKPVLTPQKTDQELHVALLAQLDRSMEQAVSIDTKHRFTTIVTTLQPVVLRFVESDSADSIPALKSWTERCSDSMLRTFKVARDHYSAHPDAKHLLGPASRRMYDFIRGHLGVPFLRAHHLRSPGPEPVPGFEHLTPSGLLSSNKENITSGTHLTKIYKAIRNGSLYVPVMECLREAQDKRQLMNGGNTPDLKISPSEKVVDSLVSESHIST